MPTLRGVDGSSCQRWKIRARVRRARLSIEDTTLAEIGAFGGALQRELKISVPQFFRGHMVEQLPQLLLFRDSARGLLFVRLDKLVFHLEAFGGKLSSPDCQRGGAGGVVAILHGRSNGKLVGARSFFEVHANEGLLNGSAAPLDCGGIRFPERKTAIHPASGDFAD